MLRSMYSAVSGLKAHQIKMDVIGNNISNVNTAGFKKSNVVFSDMMYQRQQAANGPGSSLGGTNPQNIGLGTKVSSINTIFSQGALMTTGRPSDLALQGSGFFVVTNGEEMFYTRNGNFAVDAEGYIVNSEGYRVMGENENGMLAPIRIPLGETLAPTATTSVTIGNNLKASMEVGEAHNSSIEVFDNLGGSHIVKTKFVKGSNPNEWSLEMSLDEASPMVKDWLTVNYPDYDSLSDTDKQAALDDANDALLTNRTATIIFNTDGTLDTTATQTANGATGTALLNPVSFNTTSGEPLTFDMDVSKLTQYDSKTTATALSQNGNPAGEIQSVAFDPKGNVLGVMSGGHIKQIGSLSIASFVNEEGLDPAGGSLFKMTANSGQPIYGKAGEDGSATIATGFLESSNVDLSNEVTDMIITQRGYSMNAKMITVSDEMLQELVSIKR